MAEKNALANFLDKIAGGQNREAGEDFNVLPKPASQDIGYGLIIWRWHVENITIEAALATNYVNRLSIEKGEYHITVNWPLPGDENSYSVPLEVTKEFGKAMLSAYNWKEIWKLHAGDFLLEELSQEPDEPEPYVKRPPERLPDPLTVLPPTKKFGDLETFDA
jgi:hypothetical protein